MKRIWNGLIYGDSETKKCIGSVIFFAILAIILIIVSGVTGRFGLFIVGMIMGVVALVISQSFTLVDDSFVAQVDKSGTKDTVQSVSVNMNEVSSPSAAEFDQYNLQKMKKIQKKYHVKKDHRPIIVDSSLSYHIKECPAFIWRTHNKVFLLLLEKEPRRICISRDMILNMRYAPKVRADRSKEYLAFEKDNLITSVFKEYIPDYFDSKANNANLKYKNLYEIYPDIRISNRCAATVMDLLYLNFMPEDKITQSEKLNGFFKRIYAAHILYQDHVYSIREYKESVETILKEMCYAQMPDQEFAITLENLIKGKMISKEYADHYMELKSKIAGRMVQVNMLR